MTNIWRFSLIFAFIVILDQLIKASIQGFLSSSDTIVIYSFISIRQSMGGISSLDDYFGKAWANRMVCSVYLFLIYYILRDLVVERNLSFARGLMRTFIVIGLFSSFFDRITLGYLFKYISIVFFETNLGEIFLFTGLLGFIVMKLKKVLV